jgi:hypothetical protein
VVWSLRTVGDAVALSLLARRQGAALDARHLTYAAAALLLGTAALAPAYFSAGLGVRVGYGVLAGGVLAGWGVRLLRGDRAVSAGLRAA